MLLSPTSRQESLTISTGRSNYVTEGSLGLAAVKGNSFILRADDTTKLSPGGKGRDSFRIGSMARMSLC
jgi:hypothetical protein